MSWPVKAMYPLDTVKRLFLIETGSKINYSYAQKFITWLEKRLQHHSPKTDGIPEFHWWVVTQIHQFSEHNS